MLYRHAHRIMIAIIVFAGIIALFLIARAQPAGPEWPSVDSWGDYSSEINPAWKASTGYQVDPWEWATWYADPSDDAIDSRIVVFEHGGITCELTRIGDETCLQCDTGSSTTSPECFDPSGVMP